MARFAVVITMAFIYEPEDEEQDIDDIHDEISNDPLEFLDGKKVETDTIILPLKRN